MTGVVIFTLKNAFVDNFGHKWENLVMKKRAKIALAGVAAGALAVTAMILNKHLEIQRENDTDTIIRESDDPISGSLEGKLPDKEKKAPAEKTLTEVTPDTEENLTEISPEPEIKPAECEIDAFYISHIPNDIFVKMQGRSYKADCTIDREELRYVHILHTGFDGETKEGELVVNKAIADDVLAIFEELYLAKYPIEKVRLVDEYDADDEASMSDNNSSAFNFRTISHTTTISKHGLGMAIDINPLYNPYVKTVSGALSIEPANAAAYVDRSEDNPYRIDHDDLCYKLFTEHGFTWGGDWVHSKDYQHFEKELK